MKHFLVAGDIGISVMLHILNVVQRKQNNPNVKPCGSFVVVLFLSNVLLLYEQNEVKKQQIERIADDTNISKI